MNIPNNNISSKRKEAGVKQADLGRAFDPPLSQVAVSYHERGKRLPDVYQALVYAQILGCTVEDLFPLSVPDGKN